MRLVLIGIQSISFTNNNGEEIKGHNLYVTYPDENVQGLKADKIFLKENIKLPQGIKLNQEIDAVFNMRGKIEAIYNVEK